MSVHSAVSGRALALAVDQRGAGGDTVYVNDDPRAFFLVVEGADLEWRVEVAGGVRARALAR